jgi:hypothetical protein
MVTRSQIDKLGTRIEELAALLDPDAGQVTVAVFRGETPEFAARRHCELRPEHSGRQMRFDYRTLERSELGEELAVRAGATADDLQQFRRTLAEIDGTSRNFIPADVPQEAES